MTAQPDSLVLGLAAAAGSLVLRAMGVEPDVVLVAVCSCLFGALLARPQDGRWMAMATFGASVVLTCRLSAVAAAGVIWHWPTLAAYASHVTAAAAIVVGVCLRVAISHVPAVIAAQRRRWMPTQ